MTTMHTKDNADFYMPIEILLLENSAYAHSNYHERSACMLGITPRLMVAMEKEREFISSLLSSAPTLHPTPGFTKT